VNQKEAQEERAQDPAVGVQRARHSRKGRAKS
jgi:hypothetical protein